MIIQSDAPLIPAPTRNMEPTTGFGISTERLEECLAEYNEEQREPIRHWFYLGKEKGWTLKQMAKATSLSTTTLSRVFRGSYGADISSVLVTLERAKTNFAEAVDNPDFIMTSLAKRLFAAFDKTRALENVTIMWGPKGIGKTEVAMEYARQNNHGRTGYVRCPGTGCTIYQFVQLLAQALKISSGNNMMVLREKIITAMSRGGRLLLVDELHEIFLVCSPVSIIRICEFLREIKDVSGCGLVLIGTEVLEKEFFRGAYYKVLEQLVDRGTVQIPLPAKPTQKDIIEFLAHFGLDLPDQQRDAEAFKMLNDILRSEGLRKLTHHLRDGASYAGKIGQAYTWNHFVAGFDAIRKLSK